MSIAVLHLCSSLGMFGGEHAILTLVQGMKVSNFKHTIGVLKNSHNPNIDLVYSASELGIDTTVFPCDGRLDFNAILAIHNLLRQENIQIIHSHDYKSDLYACLAALFTNTRTIATCHNWIVTSHKSLFYARLDQFLLRFFDFIVTVSPMIGHTLIEHGISPDKTEIIYNGVLIDAYHSRDAGTDRRLKRSLKIPPESLIVGSVGRLSPEKGLAYFLTAAKEVLRNFPTCIFLVIGNGPDNENLVRLADQLGISNKVVFTGFQSNTAKFYSIMDVMVISSITEGLPMVLLEAMASEKPVVSTRVGSIPRVLQHGIHGLLVEPGNVRQLGDAIKYLLENKRKAQQFGKKGYERVATHFSSISMSLQYEEIYTRLLQFHA